MVRFMDGGQVERGGTATLDAVVAMRQQLLSLDLDLTDPERVASLRALTDLANSISATQARLIHDLDASQRAADEAAGVPADRRRGVTGRVASALRESPRTAMIAVGVAKALVTEMPHTMTALKAGVLSWYRARLLVSETACLSLADRRTVDREVCGDLSSLEGLGTKKLTNWAREVGYGLDPAGAVRRIAKAENERYVSLRPAPDCMTYLTALLPVAQGVACYAALSAAAASGMAGGDGRGRGQLMADSLVRRLTGQEAADAVPVGLHLVMTDAALFLGDATPGRIVGHGPVPARLARQLITAAPAAASWVRRLYSGDAGLVAGESRSRCFPEGLAELIRIRDDTCTTPYCDAPIRHVDHIRPWAAGGRTTLDNGQGLCEQCNLDKQDSVGLTGSARAHPHVSRGQPRTPYVDWGWATAA